MSFSSTAKNELARIKTEGRCCNRAELSGIIRVSGALEFGGKNMMNLRVVTENPAVARLIFVFLKKLYQLNTELIMKENKVLNKHHSYEMFIENANALLTDLSILKMDGGAYLLNDDLPIGILKKNCCKKAYLRGIFLGGGSLSAPEKSYHLELITHNEFYAEQLVLFINDLYDLGAKVTARKKNFIVYIKESERIVDFLNVIGAHQTLLEYENIRILKQMRNNVNRVVNCETANLTKTADAAFEHIHAIEAIIETVGLDYLDDRLREIAEVRLENPEATLKELGEMLTPTIGKSGVNHRLKKIIEISEQIKKRKE